jgi:hypothetical protein
MKWVSCDKRLPKDGDWVVFCDEQAEVYAGIYQSRHWKCWNGDREYTTFYEPVDRTKKKHKYVTRVMFWSPVPAPPAIPKINYTITEKEQPIYKQPVYEIKKPHEHTWVRLSGSQAKCETCEQPATIIG